MRLLRNFRSKSFSLMASGPGARLRRTRLARQRRLELCLIKLTLDLVVEVSVPSLVPGQHPLSGSRWS